MFVTSEGIAQTATVRGTVRDSVGHPLTGATVSVFGTSLGTSTDSSGYYLLVIPAEQSVKIMFSHLSLATDSVTLNLENHKEMVLDKVLKKRVNELPIYVIHDVYHNPTMVPMDPIHALVIPGPGGNSVENLIKTSLGVASNNELSSQYNVRGGNYAENLLYVNGIEIYRPILPRSGQQEGLSFINADMVDKIQFSAGGFEAQYGDKLSSVLDITYKKPDSLAVDVSLSLLGESITLEGTNKRKEPKHKFTYIFGARRKTNSYILNSLDTKGAYRPSFLDLQGYMTYVLNPRWELTALGNFASNQFSLVPENRETTLGTVSQALKLSIYFDGQEADQTQAETAALTAIHTSLSDKTRLKFIASLFQSHEKEAFDILGQYYLDKLENDFGSKNFGDVKFNLGVGSFLSHARNYLDANVYNFEHKGTHKIKHGELLWGIKYQHEVIDDKLNEWNMIDSAGYVLPINDSALILQDQVGNHINLQSNRYSGYFQTNKSFGDDSTTMYNIFAGVRAQYWDFNQQLVVSPRVTFAVVPHWKKSWTFRASAGLYFQPPFYRELRDLSGNIHPEVKAQESIHFVVGGENKFKAWDRPFVFIVEGYYKILDQIDPYKIDNVRIRYLANNSAHGFARGIDMRINGEFVKTVESWASLSVMQTEEDIVGDYYVKKYNKNGDEIIPGYTIDNVATRIDTIHPGYIPRPADQRISFTLFFQDYLPRFPTYKMHLNLIFGTGVPFGPPGIDRYKDIFRMPPYRRVDIGFSKQIIGDNVKKPLHIKVFKHLNSMWFSLEVFNLLQVPNVVSYLWVADVNGTKYAVPNYLTSRQLNARLNIRF